MILIHHIAKEVIQSAQIEDRKDNLSLSIVVRLVSQVLDNLGNILRFIFFQHFFLDFLKFLF